LYDCLHIAGLGRYTDPPDKDLVKPKDNGHTFIIVGSNPAPATNEVAHLANGLSAFLFAR
jgi:hypothetical protein